MRFSIIIAILFSFCLVLAKPINQSVAETVAQNWTQQWAPQDYLNRTIRKTISIGQINCPSLYLILYDEGFVLVAGDDAAVPIIGYGYQTLIQYPSTNPAFNDYLNGRLAEIQIIREQNLPNEETLPMWQELLQNDFSRYDTRSVSPLLTTNWNQDYPYNMLCPAAAGGPGGHVYAGCVATAMGMVMKYWNWPITGVGSHSYYVSPYGYQSANFGNTTYLWDQMPNSVSQPNEPVARLLYHCAVSVDMDFSTEGSGAQSTDAAAALRQYFRYNSGTSYVERLGYTQTNWENLLKAQLDDVHPLYYSGGGSAGGHAFVCDGYQATNYFHFNWGWSGYDNGYFYTNALNTSNGSFNQYQGVIINAHPINYSISSVRVSLEAGALMAGSTFAMNIRTYPILYSWNIQNVQFVVEFDPSNTIYNGFDATGTLLQSASISTTELSPGRILFSASSSSAIRGPGILLKTLFTPLETGTYIFNIANVMFNTTAITNLVPLLADATASVLYPQNSTIDILNAMNITYNSIATVPVTTTYIMPSWNITTMSFTLNYPNAKLQWEGYDTAGCLLAGKDITVTFPAAGQVHFQINLGTNFYGEGTLIKFKFRAIGNSVNTSVAVLSLANFYFNNTSVQNLLPGNVVLLPITDSDDPISSALYLSLLPNYPNPFTEYTSIPFVANAKTAIQITIYNLRGQKIKTLLHQEIDRGNHQIIWNGTDENGQKISAGVYYCKLQTDNFTATRRILYIK